MSEPLSKERARALILAAGQGKRLASSSPKCLLRFGGKTLLQRHLEILESCEVAEVTIVVGYGAECVREELAALEPGLQLQIETVYNAEYELGSVVSLWHLRDHLLKGGEVLLMDADVLYDWRLLARLLGSSWIDCILLDRDLQSGDEPVKLCIREGQPVEFRKSIDPQTRYDYCGESVGFFRLSEAMAYRLANRVQEYVDAGHHTEPHEEALRDLLLCFPARFGFEDITGLPWIEIDFSVDVDRGRRQVLPQLVEPGRLR